MRRSKGTLSWVAGVLLGCHVSRRDAAEVPQVAPELKKSVQQEQQDLQAQIDAEAASEVPLQKIKRLELDSPLFNLKLPSLGLGTYVGDLQVPVIRYGMPKNADYVQLLRCLSAEPLLSTTSPLALDSPTLAGMTPEARARHLSQHNYWDALVRLKGCEVVTLAHISGVIQDSFAPSGHFRYVIRACIEDSRLDLRDVAVTSNRTCSRWVQHTNLITDYRNQGLAEAAVYSRASELASAELVRKGYEIKNWAEVGVVAIEGCAESNFQRTKAKKIRDSMLQIAAVVGEVILEFYTAKQTIIEDYKGVFNAKNIAIYYGRALIGRGADGKFSFQSLLDGSQLMSTSEGMMFGDMLKNLFASASDVPRSCPEFEHHMRRIEALDQEMAQLGARKLYYDVAASHVLRGIYVIDGAPIEKIPDVPTEELQSILNAPQ